MKPSITICFIAVCAVTTGARGQIGTQSLTVAKVAWKDCIALSNDSAARLSCFDAWAAQQTTARPMLESTQAMPAPTAPTPLLAAAVAAPAEHDCKSRQFSELSRFWELEAGSDCGTFGIRGFRPISLSWISSDGVNTQPTSPSPGHSATSAVAYIPSETRISLSVRTKMAQGLLTGQQQRKRDSLWFGYSQQSNWQIFSGDLSRPFRSTDHEPELTYIYPTDAELPLGWHLRYSGISLVHQSNGQPLPLSRSWNRAMLLTGLEKGDQFRLEAKLWKRLDEDPFSDDNPDISDKIGRAELAGFWNPNPDQTFGLTLRHSLRAQANGSLRLEWLRQLGHNGLSGSQNALRFHTQLFMGYGDSLVDYNRRRSVLSIGLSLVDW